MKIEIKLIRNQAPASPRKKALGRVVALLALLALVLAIPASAKYVGEGSAVFSTLLDSALYTGTSPVTVTGTAIGLNTVGSIRAAGTADASVPTEAAVRAAINALNTWEDLTVTAGTTAAPPMLQLNKATRQIRMRLSGQPTTSGTIGQVLFTITYPSGFAPASTRRAVISIDYAGNTGRQTVGIDFNTSGAVLLYPHTPALFTGTLTGLQGAGLFGDVMFNID